METTLKLKFTEDENVQLTIDSKTLLKNGEASQMDVAPTIVNDRTMVPVRFIAEALGGMVEWHEDIQTAYIVYQDNMDRSADSIHHHSCEWRSKNHRYTFSDYRRPYHDTAAGCCRRFGFRCQL